MSFAIVYTISRPFSHAWSGVRIAAAALNLHTGGLIDLITSSWGLGMRYKWLLSAVFAVGISALGATNAGATAIFSDNFNTENGGAGALNYSSFANFTVTNGT